MRYVNREDVEIVVVAHDEDIPVRGNVSVSDDPDFDREVEDEILSRLNRGDVWAWACVEVRAVFRGIRSEPVYLGGCSYRDEADFREPGGYFDDMVEEALDDLNRQIGLAEKECGCPH